MSLTDTLSRLEQLPPAEKSRLEKLSISNLIHNLEKIGFECEGGPLVNFTEWLELKARIAELSLQAHANLKD